MWSPEQAAPDGDFPTVPFPNPEEHGATDLLLALAARVNADIAIALDPDADRCALGIPSPGGGWRMLTGDETGTLLGDHVLRTLDRAAHPDPLVATTIVSGELLGLIAAAHNARYDETLTGFKWIVRAGDGAGTGLVFGYEEALGLCVDPDRVRDKDGISAAVLACDLLASLRAQGHTLQDRMDDLARTHGLWITGQHSVRVQDLTQISAAMTRLRHGPPDDPARRAGVRGDRPAAADRRAPVAHRAGAGGHQAVGHGTQAQGLSAADHPGTGRRRPSRTAGHRGRGNGRPHRRNRGGHRALIRDRKPKPDPRRAQ